MAEEMQMILWILVALEAYALVQYIVVLMRRRDLERIFQRDREQMIAERNRRFRTLYDSIYGDYGDGGNGKV